MPARSSSHEQDLAQANADDEQAIIDRKIYIDSVSKGFRARGKGVILELKLALEKTKIHRGEPIRYRFAITNIGSEPFTFTELTQSFFKTGRLPSDAITMTIKDPRGNTGGARSAFTRRSDTVREEIALPPGLSEAQRADKYESMRRSAKSEARLIQRLAPGETLHTLGDKAPRGFRTLNVDNRFSFDGTYELRLALDAFLKSETSSNLVKIDIVP